MSLVEKIKAVEYHPDGVTIHTEKSRMVMSQEWAQVNRPRAGDMITQNNEGYYSVCPQSAFIAIREVFII